MSSSSDEILHETTHNKQLKRLCKKKKNPFSTRKYNWEVKINVPSYLKFDHLHINRD